MLKLIMHESSLELRRQLLHLTFGLFLSLMIALDYFNVAFFVFLLFFSVLLSFFSKFVNIPGVTFLLEHFDRPSDRKFFPGKGFITFLIGTVTSYIIFAVIFHSRFAALIAVLSLTIADSFSSLYGIMFGKIKNPLNRKKSVEGAVFALLFLFFVLMLFLPVFDAFFLSVLCVLFETIELKVFGRVLDDNIYLPLLAGTVILLLNTL